MVAAGAGSRLREAETPPPEDRPGEAHRSERCCGRRTPAAFDTYLPLAAPQHTAGHPILARLANLLLLVCEGSTRSLVPECAGTSRRGDWISSTRCRKTDAFAFSRAKTGWPASRRRGHFARSIAAYGRLRSRIHCQRPSQVAGEP